MSDDTFFDLFSEQEQYPSDFAAAEMFPIGTCYEYVSSTLLNGIINYTPVIRAWCLSHYLELDGQFDFPVQMTANGRENIFRTKREVYEAAASAEDIFHTDLHMFRDDLILLARVQNAYWFYWFDCDVSDCFIGRFETDLDQDSIVGLFDSFAAESEANQHGKPLLVPLNCLKGWMHF